jgi:hypothetical protein
LAAYDTDDDRNKHQPATRQGERDKNIASPSQLLSYET